MPPSASSIPDTFEADTLLIVITDLDNFDSIGGSENKNRAVLSINAKTPDMHVLWFKQLGFKTGMKRVEFKISYLLRQLPLELTLPNIGNSIRTDREDSHVLKWEDR